MQFDHIPFEDLNGDWHKLGSGSFGNVYKGSYLGTDVAIKEVLPSNDYDVRKYFEREWKLMREARHPNVVLFLGLSSAPDGRVFIVSEFIENGNLRQYILSKTKPFPWRLRISFCIDIARALAYLHARNCVHRDIKGENLLLTSNGRLKITDFGFARITPRSPEEAKRLTYCGTDAYMSPEILMGDPFDLPTDVFSLGIIYCEILCRRVADDKTFKRAAPLYSLNASELHNLATPGCPSGLIQLALDCCSVFPANRPSMVEVLARLSSIEAEVLARGTDEPEPVGTAKFFTAGGGQPPGTKRPRMAPRIPSFGMGIGAEIRISGVADIQIPPPVSPVDVPASPPSDYGDDPDAEPLSPNEQEQADGKISPPLDDTSPGEGLKRTPSWAAYGSTMMGRSSMLGDKSSWSQAEMIPSEANSATHLLDHAEEGHASGSDDVAHKPDGAETGSGLTVRASRSTVRISPAAAVGPSAANGNPAIDPDATLTADREYVSEGVQVPTPPQQGSNLSGKSFHTAIVHEPGSASVLSQVSSQVVVHRFTLIKPAKSNPPTAPSSGGGSGWAALNFFFSPRGRGKAHNTNAKCDLCTKKIGPKAPALECDDCGMRCHVKCGENAPRDCGVRFPRAAPALPLASARSVEPAVRPAVVRSPPTSPGRWRKSPRSGLLGLGRASSPPSSQVG